MAPKKHKPDPPESYFEYMNRSIFKVFGVFKTKRQVGSILPPTWLHLATRKGRKSSLKGVARGIRTSIDFGTHFWSPWGTQMAATWPPKRAQARPKGLPEAPRRGGRTAPKSSPKGEPFQGALGTPKRCSQTPPLGANLAAFWHSFWLRILTLFYTGVKPGHVVKVPSSELVALIQGGCECSKRAEASVGRRLGDQGKSQ